MREAGIEDLTLVWQTHYKRSRQKQRVSYFISLNKRMKEQRLQK